jgi:hypothetical protein
VSVVTANLKVKLSLCVINDHDLKIYGGVYSYFHPFLTSKIFGPKREEITLDWIKLYIHALPNLYCSTGRDKQRKMRAG